MLEKESNRSSILTPAFKRFIRGMIRDGCTVHLCELMREIFPQARGTAIAPDWYEEEEVADHLFISVAELRRLGSIGAIGYASIEGRYCILREDLFAYMRRKKEASDADAAGRSSVSTAAQSAEVRKETSLAELPILYTEKEVATYLQISLSTLRRLRTTGALNFIKIGGKPAITEQQLRLYIKRLEAVRKKPEAQD